MSILTKLFDKKKSNDEFSTPSAQVKEVLNALKNKDISVRLSTMGIAARLLGAQESGALQPFIFSIQDENELVRNSTIQMLASATQDELLKTIVQTVIHRDSEGKKFVDLITKTSKNDSEDLCRKGAQQVLNNISKPGADLSH